MGLVEPDAFARHRMASRGRRLLERPQLAVGLPFEVDAAASTDRLDAGLVVRLERARPRYIEAAPEVAHVQYPAVFETTADAGRDASIHFTAVGNRRLAAALRELL